MTKNLSRIEQTPFYECRILRVDANGGVWGCLLLRVIFDCEKMDRFCFLIAVSVVFFE